MPPLHQHRRQQLFEEKMAMTEEQYLGVLIESLEKKLKVLGMISERNLAQKEILDKDTAGPEELSFTISEKEKLINELARLDEGFDEVFKRVEKAVTENPGAYKDKIARLQELIRQITAKEADVRAEEARNYEKAKLKFATVKKQIKTLNTNSRAVSSYYKKAMDYKGGFMDGKK